MAAKRKKLKADLGDTMFRYEDKKEELMEYFETNNTYRGRQFNVGVAKVTSDELSSK